MSKFLFYYISKVENVHVIYVVGLKSSPRFREGVAYLRTRHQPPHIRYPLIGFEIVANVGTFSAEQINLNDDVSRENTVI